MNLQISVQNRGNAAVMMVSGVLDSKTQAVFKQKAEDLLKTTPCAQVVFDFSSLQSIEPASSGMIMFLSHAAKAKNKALSIGRPSPAVMQFLTKANINKVVPIQ